jgi:hypothetical protein
MLERQQPALGDFATVVRTEYSMGNRQQAEWTLAKAEKGYRDGPREVDQL